MRRFFDIYGYVQDKTAWLNESFPPLANLIKAGAFRLEEFAVRDGLPLPAVEPAGQHTEHHLPRHGVDHKRSLFHGDVRRMAAERWNTTRLS